MFEKMSRSQLEKLHYNKVLEIFNLKGEVLTLKNFFSDGCVLELLDIVPKHLGVL